MGWWGKLPVTFDIAENKSKLKLAHFLPMGQPRLMHNSRENDVNLFAAPMAEFTAPAAEFAAPIVDDFASLNESATSSIAALISLTLSKNVSAADLIILYLFSFSVEVEERRRGGMWGRGVFNQPLHLFNTRSFICLASNRTHKTRRRRPSGSLLCVRLHRLHAFTVA